MDPQSDGNEPFLSVGNILEAYFYHEKVEYMTEDGWRTTIVDKIDLEQNSLQLEFPDRSLISFPINDPHKLRPYRGTLLLGNRSVWDQTNLDDIEKAKKITKFPFRLTKATKPLQDSTKRKADFVPDEFLSTERRAPPLPRSLLMEIETEKHRRNTGAAISPKSRPSKTMKVSRKKREENDPSSKRRRGSYSKKD